MGREARLTISGAGDTAEARVHLDSEALTIGPPFRLKLALAEVTEAKAGAKGLSIATRANRLTLAMSEKEAGAWAKAVLNPPSLATKLGLKSGLDVAAIGALPPEIAAALADLKLTPGKPPAALAFAMVPEGVAVKDLGKLAKALPDKGAVWLVYAKGEAINGDQLIYAARDAGLKDTKVAKISERHAALRFIRA